MNMLRLLTLRLVWVCAIALMCAGTTTRAEEPAAIFNVWETPRPVADLSFIDGDGNKMALSAYRGKFVLLNIWATWCPPCRKEMPALDRLEQMLGSPRFKVIALSTDTSGLPDVKAFYQSLGLKSLGVFLDEEGAAMRDLRIIGLPTTILIDEQGSEIARKIGPATWDSEEVVEFLRGHLYNVKPDP